MRRSPVRFMSQVVVSTFLFYSAVNAEPLLSTNGWRSPQVRFGDLGLQRDPSCTEKKWAQIEDEKVPLNPKVVSYLLGDSNTPPAKILCDFPLLDLTLFVGPQTATKFKLDYKNRIFTFKNMIMACGADLCGPARKLFEELEKRDLRPAQ